MGPLVETDEKELIFWIRGFEKLEGRFFGLAEFVGHAAAEIQDDTDRDGNIFGGEIHDLLLDVVFEEAEVVGLETCGDSVVRVGDGDIDECQI